MSEDQYQQEFECSFEAAIKGAFYADEMRTMRRICPIEINKDEPSPRPDCCPLPRVCRSSRVSCSPRPASPLPRAHTSPTHRRGRARPHCSGRNTDAPAVPGRDPVHHCAIPEHGQIEAVPVEGDELRTQLANLLNEVAYQLGFGTLTNVRRAQRIR